MGKRTILLWNALCHELLKYLDCRSRVFYAIRRQVSRLRTSGMASAEGFESCGSERVGDQVGAWDGPLMPGERGVSGRGRGPGLLLKADLVGHDASRQVLRSAKAGMPRWAGAQTAQLNPSQS